MRMREKRHDQRQRLRTVLLGLSQAGKGLFILNSKGFELLLKLDEDWDFGLIFLKRCTLLSLFPATRKIEGTIKLG
jgi:hypothetical protein